MLYRVSVDSSKVVSESSGSGRTVVFILGTELENSDQFHNCGLM